MDFRTEIIDQPIRESFTRLMRFARNPRQALNDVGRYGVSSTRLRFRTQKGPDNRRWFPSRRVREHGGQTLRLTSRLRNSITYNADNNGVEWGTNVKYAPAHQFGVYKAVRIPAHSRLIRKRQKYQQLTTTKAGKKRLVTRSEKVNAGRTTVHAHTRIMRIPRREFLGVNAADTLAILEVMSKHLHDSVGGAT